jgi:hypothetical protein
VNLTVAITTWLTHPARIAYLRTTLESLRQHLSAGSHEIEFLVSSEAEPKGEWCGSELTRLCGDLGVPLVWRPGKANLGAHLNFLFDLVSENIWFYCQDDYALVRPLDLEPGIRLLESDSTVAMVRYYTIYATFGGGDGEWRTINLPHEQSPWPYGDNPLLAHRRWIDTAGRYVEGGDCGVHETTMIGQIRQSGLRLVVPAEMDPPNEYQEANYYFEHIGSPRVGGISAFEEKR